MDYINQLGYTESTALCFIKKRTIVKFWFSNRDRDFINVKSNNDDPAWINCNDLNNRILYLINLGYTKK